VSGAAAEIVFDRVTKRYPGRAEPAVRELTMTVPAGQICCLVGPSGAGKTTAMKMVNRLIDIDEGDITIGGRSVKSMVVTELRRSIGYVIQQVGLFPHMTVADNVATVPRLLGRPKAEIDERVDELLDLVDLPADDYRERFPSQLSGGERQRVGLARALAANPPAMLPPVCASAGVETNANKTTSAALAAILRDARPSQPSVRRLRLLWASLLRGCESFMCLGSEYSRHRVGCDSLRSLIRGRR